MKSAMERILQAIIKAWMSTVFFIGAWMMVDVAITKGLRPFKIVAICTTVFLIYQLIVTIRDAKREASEEAEESDGMDREIMLKESVVQAALLLWICDKTSQDRVHYEKVLEAESRRLAEFMDKQYETKYQSEKEERDEREPVPEADEMPKM